MSQRGGGGAGGRGGGGRGGRGGRGGVGGRGGRGGGRRTDQGQSQPSGVQTPFPALQSSGGGGASASGGRGRGSVDHGKAPEISGASVSTPSASSSRSAISAPAGSSSAPPSSVDTLSKEVSEKLQLTPAKLGSSKAGMRFRTRPGFGRAGRKITVRANHFLVEVADRDLCHYDVNITPEVKLKETNRLIMAELVRCHGQTHLGGRLPAYDGMKSLYTAGALPFESREFSVKLPASSSRKEKQFKVAIKLASRPDLYHLQQFLRQKQMDAPYETVQVLDVVLRMGPSQECVTIGRSFFDPRLGRRGELQNGVEYWSGFYQSLRLTQMGISLNIDVSARSFYEPILVTEFIKKYLNIRDFNKPLQDTDLAKVKKVLKSLKVDLVHWDYERSCKISGISRCPISQLDFPLDDQGTRMTVVQFFREKYDYRVKYPFLPAVQSGSASKPAYFPMELCSIAEGQRYTKRLNPRQVTNLLRATCQRPRDREDTIKGIVTHNSFNKNKLVNNEFGIRVHEQLTVVEARVLPPPLLKYHGTGREAMMEPKLGQWNMIDRKMVNGARVDFWACVNFSKRVDPKLLQEFCGRLIGMCVSKGMQFHPEPVIPFFSSPPEKIEDALINIHKRSTQRVNRTPQLLIIILPDVTGSYGKIKRICETELGIVSQCCQPSQAAKLNKQYMENVAMKMNVKVGGRNTVLNDAIQKTIPLVCDRPTIIIGADVTHPQSGEDSSPSIAAVVASMDWPEITKYRGLVSAQTHREEIIEDLYKLVQDPQKGWVHSGMIRELLLAFRRSTGLKPERIIFYRDGVSEGQFSQVLLHEMEAIRKACTSLEEKYVPPVTFIVVQKRHHTRLFPAQHGSRDLTDRSGNILPGTVVDTKICHPIEFDFYLNSHAGIQGTSRPAHYHVLFDENGFSADGLQIFTNNLCYTFARCTRSVSIVPPVYYAHLTAFRARYYMENEASDGGSSSGQSRSTAADIRSLPAIKDSVKDVMFFC